MRKGYRVIDVAKMLEVNPSAVSRWEQGTSMPNTIKLVKLADLYGVPLDNLIIRQLEK